MVVEEEVAEAPEKITEVKEKVNVKDRFMQMRAAVVQILKVRREKKKERASERARARATAAERTNDATNADVGRRRTSVC